MHRAMFRRRSFLASAFAAPALMVLAGCSEEDKQLTEIRNADPNEKAKESMDFYKNNVLKKKK